MDKRKAVQIMTKAAVLYRANLENRKVLFLYGVPTEIRKEQEEKEGILSIKGYETAFHRSNFLHLTGVKVNAAGIMSSVHFYEKCLDNRLTLEDFYFAKDGSTVQKLDILENMMKIKQNVRMIGDFSAQGPKLYTEKAAGNVYGCIGFVRDKNTKQNVPNTLLKKDIRDVIVSPMQKVYFVLSKSYTEEKYSVLEKNDKEIDIRACVFSEKIEEMLNRKSF